MGEAFVELRTAANFLTDDPAARHAAAEAAATKALSLAPNHAFAHYVLGHIRIRTDRAAQGIVKCEHALALDRNLAYAHAAIGLAKIALGRAEETEAHILDALRLSPRDVLAYHWMYLAGYAMLLLGSDEDAVAWQRRSIEANRNFLNAHFTLAGALARLGTANEASAAVKAGLALNPTFTIRRVRTSVISDNPTFLAQFERALDSLRKAGVPEG